MFPTGIITREIKVGPAFDLVSGTPYTIRVMIEATRSLVWGATNDPIMAKLQTFTIEANTSGFIALPVTNQNGFETSRGENIILGQNDHAFGYEISMFYLIGGSVSKKTAKKVIVLPLGNGAPVNIDDLLTLGSGQSGNTISTPDIWSAQIAEALEAAQAAAASAAEAEEAVEQLEGNIDLAVTEWFDENSAVIVSPSALSTAINNHKNEESPHRAYDLDIPSLTVLFENGLA